MKKFMKKAKDLATRQAVKIQAAVCNNNGEGYIDTAVKILIAVVLGALLLAGLYALFGNIVMPTLTQRIKDMFNYSGSVH
jgi:hypothetical protein